MNKIIYGAISRNNKCSYLITKIQKINSAGTIWFDYKDVLYNKDWPFKIGYDGYYFEISGGRRVHLLKDKHGLKSILKIIFGELS